jgi:pimeloyl-ACP methyl ester carboxylesterase
VKKVLITLALVLSGVAVILAMDPGRFAFSFVDAGGHELRLLISGRGSPAVVFEGGGSASFGAPLEMWLRVQPAVSRFATTVSYDRAGVGWSPPGPMPRDARQVARELHTALRNAGVAPPYILVGHSFGGPFIRVFAGLFPGDVAGMVLVDPTQEEFVAWNQARNSNRVEMGKDAWKEIQASLAQAHDSRVPEGVPVDLITAMGPRELPNFATAQEKREYRDIHQIWLKFHSEWIAKVPGGQHIITENSGHGVPFFEPGLVIDAIRKMVDRDRNRR